MDFKNIVVRNTQTGEEKKFESLNDFKAFFTDFNIILDNYCKSNKNTNENTFLKAFDFNWNSWRTNHWAIMSYSKHSQNKKRVGNKQGSLFYSETLKKWVFQYTLNGKRQSTSQHVKKCETVTQFKNRVIELQNKLQNGTFVKKDIISLYSIIFNHIKLKYKKGTISAASYKRNLESLAQIEKCFQNLKKPIQKITIDDVENASINMSEKYSQSCINKQWGLLQKGFSIAYSRKVIAFNFMLDENLKKAPVSKLEIKQVESLTVQEQAKLEHILTVEESSHKYSDIALFELSTAMRIGEVLARSFSDYDDEKSKIHVHNTLTKDENDKLIIGTHTKTYNKDTGIDLGERILPLSQTSIDIITTHSNVKTKNIHNLIFWDYEKNKLISPSAVNSWLKRLNEKYNITPNELSTHVLRHTRITRWREAGIDPKVISYWAGHTEKSNITDKVYFTLTEDYLDEQAKKLG